MTYLSSKYAGGFATVPWATNAETFTPSISESANVTWTGLKWRIGNMLHMQIYGTATGALSGSPALTLPDSLSCDTTLSNQNRPFGWGTLHDVGSAFHTVAFLQSGTATQLTMAAVQIISSVDVRFESVTAAIPVTVANGDEFSFQIAVPISGWDVERNLTPRGSTFRGALVNRATVNQSIDTGTDSPINFTTETYDTDGFHDNSTNNTRLTIPAGVSKVKLTASGFLDTSTSLYTQFKIYKNGAAFAGYPIVMVETAAAQAIENVTSAVLDVVQGDYFEFVVYHAHGSAINLLAGNEVWFSIEVVE